MLIIPLSISLNIEKEITQRIFLLNLQIKYLYARVPLTVGLFIKILTHKDCHHIIYEKI